MADMIKKLMYTGVGLVTTTTEKVQELVDELVEKGKLSNDEGKKVVDDLVTDTKTKRGEFEDRFRKGVEDVLSKFSLPSAAEIKALTERIEALEAQLAKKPAAKRTSAKKTASA